ncbi:acyltransferase [Hylemonella gracilis str. Niagara R]|uniref:Apolipoprotein N-acyltransferase n=1 Tax=Hylemonella gracilis str. Niagara R TaxID=1458275 RepID=A0A016XMC6_9BURK|nr:apolipoprotein N-acyltransferase [Hylemonella gracilis]EYC52727.1 acyltransferase [Hylemonella gracilis str. Niagara R]
MPDRRKAIWAQASRISLALLAGGLQALSIATPWSGEPQAGLQLLSLTLLASVLTRPAWPGTTSPSAPAASAAMLGWLYALAWLAGTFWWMFIAMHRYGGLPAPFAVLAVLALAGTLALYAAAACALYGHLIRRLGQGRPAVHAFLFAALWLLAELARGRWFTGFGWGGPGYAHVEGPLAAYAPWIGVYGITAVTAWLAMMLASTGWQLWPALRGRSGAERAGALKLATKAALAVVLVMYLPSLQERWVPLISASSGTLRIALLQGNIPQDEKFQPGSGVALSLRWYGEQLMQAPQDADLVVAPETALPLLPQDLPAGYWPRLEALYARTGTSAALIGLPLGNFREGYTNSVIGLAPGQQPYRYDKHHLVPFGEFIPLGFRWFTAMMQIPLGDFNRGELNQPSFAWLGQRLALNICYEDLFGEELGARFADVQTAPTVFVNVSNIAWFGDTVAVAQHLHISRMRALEFARPMVRATNTGATAWINHQGQVRAMLAPHTRGVLTVEVEGRTGLTPYARWVAAFGLGPLWLLSLLVLSWAVWRGRSRPTPTAGAEP